MSEFIANNARQALDLVSRDISVVICSANILSHYY